MRYLGGKKRIAKYIAKLINENYDFDVYVEPFCGTCSVAALVNRDIPKICNDLCPFLVELLKQVQLGKEYPEFINEEVYKYIKDNKEKGEIDLDLIAFVGYGCSFGAKFFGGYARSSKKRNYAKAASNQLKKLRPKIVDINFINYSYDELYLPSYHKHLIYCDPPYKGTTKAGSSKEGFDYDKFLVWCNKQAKNNIVLISEYNKPALINTKLVWEKEKSRDLKSSKNKKVTEKLFEVIYNEDLR